MNRNLGFATVCITLIVIITLASAIPFGFHKTEQLVNSILANQVIPVMEEGNTYGGTLPGPVIYRLTLANTFIPRQVVLPRATACLYNAQRHQGMYVNTHWQVSTLETTQSAFGSSDRPVVQLGRETRTVELTIDQFIRWKHPPQPMGPETKAMPPAPLPAGLVDYPEGFDSLYLFLTDKDNNNNYIPCDNLQPVDLAMAKRILILNEGSKGVLV